jgi:hypothetical protein
MAEYEVWLTQVTRESGRVCVQADSPEEATRKVEDLMNDDDIGKYPDIEWGYEPEGLEGPDIVEAIEVSPC